MSHPASACIQLPRVGRRLCLVFSSSSSIVPSKTISSLFSCSQQSCTHIRSRHALRPPSPSPPHQPFRLPPEQAVLAATTPVCRHWGPGSLYLAARTHALFVNDITHYRDTNIGSQKVSRFLLWRQYCIALLDRPPLPHKQFRSHGQIINGPLGHAWPCGTDCAMRSASQPRRRK